jgi:acyl-CoA synthetase (NDP forming)
MNGELPSATETLARMLKARSVAIVGASDDPRKLGYATLATLVSGGYDGKVYPVNPKAGTVQGLPAFSSLSAIPAQIDLAVIIVPAVAVAGVVREAATKGASGTIIHSGGFRESGNIALEVGLVRAARDAGLRFLGPNIQGAIYTPNRLSAVFWPSVKRLGSIGVVSQSGTVTGALCDRSNDDGLGLSAAINLGNQADLCESDVIEFLATDEHTRAIAIYMEGARDGRRFLETAARAAQQKPIVILKTGRTAGGAAATASHTGSLAGRDEVFSAACRQYGLVRVDDVDSLYDSAKALAMLPSPADNRVLIVTSSGGSGALAVDEAERHGLSVPRLTPDLVDQLRQINLPPFASFANPVDLAMVAAEPFKDVALKAKSFNAADIFLFIFGDPTPGSAVVVQEVAARLHAPIAVCCYGGGGVEKEETAKMHAAGIPVFPTPERAIRGIAATVRYAQFRQAPPAQGE